MYRQASGSWNKLCRQDYEKHRSKDVQHKYITFVEEIKCSYEEETYWRTIHLVWASVSGRMLCPCSSWFFLSICFKSIMKHHSPATSTLTICRSSEIRRVVNPGLITQILMKTGEIEKLSFSLAEFKWPA